MSDGDIEKKASDLATIYDVDLDHPELIKELKDLKTIYDTNLGKNTLIPWQLLNSLKSNNIDELYPNVVTALRIFLTIPSTVASAERSFSHLKRVKSVLRSTMCQDRLSSLGVLSVEAGLARTINLETVIGDFARKKARKIMIE